MAVMKAIYKINIKITRARCEREKFFNIMILRQIGVFNYILFL